MASSSSPASRRVLVVVAAPVEAVAILGPRPIKAWEVISVSPGLDMVVSGIGKANAAGATGRFANEHDAVISVGIAGSLNSDMSIGQVVVASASVFADEGLEAPGGFTDCSGMGFPLGDFTGSAVPVSAEWNSWLHEVCGRSGPVRSGAIATVSTCSGTDVLRTRTAMRTGAVAEAMEGAAVGLVAHRLGLAFGEVRVVSNTTGDRDRQVWNMGLALGRLTQVMGAVAQELRRIP